MFPDHVDGDKRFLDWISHKLFDDDNLDVMMRSASWIPSLNLTVMWVLNDLYIFMIYIIV